MSQVVSPRELFPSDDILLISTVDSANFAKQGITVDQVINYLFRLDKEKTLQSNKMMMGFVANKLLLAFKNKPGFLETLVMDSSPSLMNILQNIKRIMVEKNWATPEQMSKHQSDYIEAQKASPNVKVDGSIIVQYGGGSMIKAGSYDRYTPFKNNPDADFLVIAWPLGLVQASCNPFKPERELKGVHLGEIAQEVLSKWESQLKDRKVPLSTIKWISESSKEFGEQSVGFTFKDLVALYGERFESMDNGKLILDNFEMLMNKPFKSLTDKEMDVLDKIVVSCWDIIQANSGGHKCITNISGLNYFGRSKRPPEGKYKYDPDAEDAAYVKFTKMVQDEFVRKLKELVNQ